MYVIVALTGLPIGYSAIVALTGLPIGHIVINLIGLQLQSLLMIITGSVKVVTRHQTCHAVKHIHMIVGIAVVNS